MKKDLETLIEEALENIRDDREIAKELAMGRFFTRRV